MTPTPEMRLPTRLDRAAVLFCLDQVMDPELDESVLALGFVESVAGDDAGNLTVCLRLPTYWCAANFSYLMASDARNSLLAVEGVRSVTVKLGEHFVGAEVEEGAKEGRSFGNAFPTGGPDTLEETRRLFLIKGYYARQERLLRELKRSGLSFQDIATLRVGDAPSALASGGREDQTLERYLERRRVLELDCSPSAPLMVDLEGKAIEAAEMEAYYVRARTTRLAMEASGSLCSAMLASRNANWTRPIA